MHTGCATYGNANLAITLFQLPSPHRSGGTLRPYRLQSDICASDLPPKANICPLSDAEATAAQVPRCWNPTGARCGVLRAATTVFTVIDGDTIRIHQQTRGSFDWLQCARSTNSHSTVAILPIIDFPRNASSVIDMLAGGSKN